MQNIPKIIHYVWFRAPQGFAYLDNAIALKNWSNVSNFLRLWAVQNWVYIYVYRF